METIVYFFSNETFDGKAVEVTPIKESIQTQPDAPRKATKKYSPEYSGLASGDFGEITPGNAPGTASGELVRIQLPQKYNYDLKQQ